jgi:transposase
MSKAGRPKAPLILTSDERVELERLTRRSRTNRRLAFRAALVLACADGATNTAVARRYRTSNQCVCLWRKRFVERRLEGLYDEPRVGGPRTISDADVERIVVKTLETKPKGKTHWSTREMAAKAGVSHTTVGSWLNHHKAGPLHACPRCGSLRRCSRCLSWLLFALLATARDATRSPATPAA